MSPTDIALTVFAISAGSALALGLNLYYRRKVNPPEPHRWFLMIGEPDDPFNPALQCVGAFSGFNIALAEGFSLAKTDQTEVWIYDAQQRQLIWCNDPETPVGQTWEKPVNVED